MATPMISRTLMLQRRLQPCQTFHCDISIDYAVKDGILEGLVLKEKRNTVVCGELGCVLYEGIFYELVLVSHCTCKVQCLPF